MQVAKLTDLQGKRYPARRWTRNLVGGASPISAAAFSMGYVVLEPDGGQVPWHHQEQEEVYFILEGTCEMCLGPERRTLTGGESVYIPPHVYHQLTNIGQTPAIMIYVYGPAGEVAHWREELAGTLPKAGVGDVPPLPRDARPQIA